MRNKPWVKPELESSPFFIDDPFQKGNWKEKFARPQQPLHLELGCGKGNFAAELAAKHPEINYLAIDMKSVVLATACRHVKAEFAKAEREIDNIILTAYDIERILNIMDEKDLVERIYINFCNPWPKPRHYKKRLTHTRQLKRYQTFLKPGGELYFKTDDDGLFGDTLDYLKESGFTLLFQTYDLHSETEIENIQTEHEKKFTQQGIKTKFLIARYDGASPQKASD